MALYLIMLAALLNHTSFKGNKVLMSLFAIDLGASPATIGIVMGAFGLALMGVRTVMPALVRRSSEERVFSLSMFVAGAACIGFPFMTSLAPLLAMSFVLGLGVGCGAPLSMVLSYNRSPEGRTGEAIGLRQK